MLLHKEDSLRRKLHVAYSLILALLTDPLTYAGALATLTAITLVSCLVPAFRASRVDPMHAPRLE